MCGRFAFYSPAEAVSRLFAFETAEDLPPRYNIAPTQAAPVVRVDDQGIRRLSGLRWGLIPFWAKDPSIGNRMINARAETVASKPAFRQAFRKRRCLVLADGFYEWQKSGSGKIPWYIRSAAGEPFAMAGLWESWSGGEEEPVETCTILTTEAGRALSHIHHRMPVAIGPDGADRWLDPGSGHTSLDELVEQAKQATWMPVQVGRRVNSPANEGPDLIQPADDRSSA